MVQSPTLPDVTQRTKTSDRGGVMKALVFEAPGQIKLKEVAIPKPGYGDAVIQVTLTTICGTDLHILRGEYPVKRGLVLVFAVCGSRAPVQLSAPHRPSRGRGTVPTDRD